MDLKVWTDYNIDDEAGRASAVAICEAIAKTSPPPDQDVRVYGVAVEEDQQVDGSVKRDEFHTLLASTDSASGGEKCRTATDAAGVRHKYRQSTASPSP